MSNNRPLPAGIAEDIRQLSHSVADYSSDDVRGFSYEFRIGRVFALISLVESTIVDALWMCKNVRINGEPDGRATERMGWRRSVLQDQTFGNLVQVLSANGVSSRSIAYFRFLKGLRDQFVHRFFEDHVFPGEMREIHFVKHMRDLRYFELIFWRATHKVWRILGREKYDHVTDLGADGILVWNNFDQPG